MTKKESTKQADSRVVKAGGDSLATPNILFYVSLALFFIGSFIAETGPDHFLKLSLFAVVCLISFHLAFWVCRKLTNEKALRIVDYMYLGIAFGGVFGVLDVQSSIVKSKLPSIYAKHIKEIDATNPCKDFRSNCVWEKVILDFIKETPYNQRMVGYGLEHLPENYKGSIPADRKPYYAAVESLYDDMQDQVFRYADASEAEATNRRVFAYYLLCIGLALRLTRVSAELFNWSVPKPAPNPKQLPNYPRGAHNAVWLRRSLNENG